MANHTIHFGLVGKRQRQLARFWLAAQSVALLTLVAVIATLFVRPDTGLFIVWRLIIPFAPLLFLVAPGVWRNVCPVAVLNLLPEKLRLSQNRRIPRWMRDFGYPVSLALFFLLVPLRKLLFNHSGEALGVLVVVLGVLAVIMGVLFQRRSGLCNTFCPILPVEQIYRQTPFVTVKSSSCTTCNGCTSNCYDQMPQTAYLKGLRSRNRRNQFLQQLFVGMLPGFIVAYYLLPDGSGVSAEIAPILTLYAGLTLGSLITAGSFFLLKRFSGLHVARLTTYFGAAAFVAYYWFNAFSIALLFAVPAVPLAWVIRGALLVLTTIWIVRTQRNIPLVFRNLAR